ncbi:phosphodiesterase I [Trifolium repens]|nr:phosphodiesterase I [Trifolium repens]
MDPLTNRVEQNSNILIFKNPWDYSLGAKLFNFSCFSSALHPRLSDSGVGKSGWQSKEQLNGLHSEIKSDLIAFFTSSFASFGKRFLLSGNMSSQRDIPLSEDENEFDENSVSSSKRTKTSLAWDYFERFVDEKGLPKAKCINCGKVYMAKKDGGTSNMKNHALKCSEGGEDVSSYPPLDQERYREMIAQALMCTHDWLCGTPAPFDIDGPECVEDLSSFSTLPSLA